MILLSIIFLFQQNLNHKVVNIFTEIKVYRSIGITLYIKKLHQPTANQKTNRQIEMGS